jgi:erythromycin esterase-like protein
VLDDSSALLRTWIENVDAPARRCEQQRKGCADAAGADDCDRTAFCH